MRSITFFVGFILSASAFATTVNYQGTAVTSGCSIREIKSDQELTSCIKSSIDAAIPNAKLSLESYCVKGLGGKLLGQSAVQLKMLQDGVRIGNYAHEVTVHQSCQY